MASTPQPMPMSMASAAMRPAIRWFACWADPHWQSTVVAATSNGSTVTVLVHLPHANDDYADTDGVTPVDVDVLANDSDPEGAVHLVPGSVTVIEGASNTVSVGTTDAISASGNDNTITYKKGIAGAKPTVSATGTGNKITQAK